MTQRNKRKILRYDGSEFLIVKEENIDKDRNRDDRKNILRGLSMVSELGLIISLPMVGGILSGLWLDEKFASYPKLTLSFLFLGVIFSFTNLFILLKNLTKK